MTATDRLNAMQQRCDAATELTLGDDNAHLAYAVASEDLPATIAALRAVLAEHPSTELRVEGESFETCMVCLTTYPCPTVRAITEALT